MNTDSIHFSVGLVRDPTDSDSAIALFEQQLLLLSRAYGIDACVFSPLSIDCSLSSPEVPVQYWDGTAMRQTVAVVPKILDCRFNLLLPEVVASLSTEQHRWLLQHSTFADHRGILKEQLSQLLMCSPLYAMAIPTYKVEEYEELLRLAKMLQHCILKPSGGHHGRYVSRVDYEGITLSFENANGTKELTTELWERYKSALVRTGMGIPILQPRLNFSYDAEHAVDIRLLVAHGGSGAWEEVDSCARIGPNKLVSNVAQGGCVADTEGMLRQIAGARADELLATLHRIAAELPPMIERVVNGNITCLGFDIGIDRDTLEPYIIEANTFPGGTKSHSWDLALKRAQYYQYLLRSMA